MKILMRVLFSLIFCFAAYGTLQISNSMIAGGLTPFSDTINEHMVRGMAGRVEDLVVEREEKKSYIQEHEKTEEVDQRIEELVSDIKSRSLRRNKVKALAGILITRALGYIAAFFYLMAISGLIISRFKSVKIVWAALCANVLHFIFVFVGSFLWPTVVLAKWSSRVVYLQQLMGVSSEGGAFTLFDAVKVGFLTSFPFLLMLLVYLAICFFYFRSSLYQDKESVE